MTRSDRPDVHRVLHDDALLDALAAGRPPRASADDAPLVAALGDWRSATREPPLPASPDRRTLRRVAQLARLRAPGVSHTARAAVGIAAALTVLLGGTAVAGSRTAKPGDLLFPVTRVLWSDRADSALAEQDLGFALDRAQQLFAAGRPDDARGVLAEASRLLGRVRSEDRGRVASRIADAGSTAAPTVGAPSGPPQQERPVAGPAVARGTGPAAAGATTDTVAGPSGSDPTDPTATSGSDPGTATTTGSADPTAASPTSAAGSSGPTSPSGAGPTVPTQPTGTGGTTTSEAPVTGSGAPTTGSGPAGSSAPGVPPSDPGPSTSTAAPSTSAPASTVPSSTARAATTAPGTSRSVPAVPSPSTPSATPSAESTGTRAGLAPGTSAPVTRPTAADRSSRPPQPVPTAPTPGTTPRPG